MNGELIHSSEYPEELPGYSQQDYQPTQEPSPPKKSFWKNHYPKFFWALIVPLTVGGTIWFIVSAKPTTQTIETPYSQSAQISNLAKSTEIILNASNQNAATVLRAAEVVLRQERQNLINQKRIEVQNAIAQGRRDPDHLCYKKSLNQCLDEIQATVIDAIEVANQTNDTDELLFQTQMIEILGEIRQGHTPPGEYRPNVYKAALTQQSAAIAELQSNSVEGRAAELNSPPISEEIKGNP